MLNKIIYFSGVHGSGKSTLVKEIAKNDYFLEHKRVHSLTLDDTYIRAVWRLTKYYIEAQEQLVLSKDNENKLILGNRCVYDNFAYMNAFQKLHWVSDEEIKHHSDVFEALFSKHLLPKYVIHLAPSFDWVKERLEERWKKEDKKWREDNFKYLQKVICAYDKLYDSLSINILRLEDIDYKERINIVLDWLKNYQK